jgi:hypothetical protein
VKPASHPAPIKNDIATDMLLKPPKSQKDETQGIRDTQKQLMKESKHYTFIKAQQENIRQDRNYQRKPPPHL